MALAYAVLGRCPLHWGIRKVYSNVSTLHIHWFIRLSGAHVCLNPGGHYFRWGVIIKEGSFSIRDFICRLYHSISAAYQCIVGGKSMHRQLDKSNRILKSILRPSGDSGGVSCKDFWDGRDVCPALIGIKMSVTASCRTCSIVQKSSLLAKSKRKCLHGSLHFMDVIAISLDLIGIKMICPCGELR